MKRTISLFWPIAISFLLAIITNGCASDIDCAISPYDSNPPMMTKGSGNPDGSEESWYSVTMDDIQDYLHFKLLEAKDQGLSLEVEDVKPLKSETGSTLCYLLQYSSGWEAISADKRAPVVLARCDSPENEFLNDPDRNDSAWAWLWCIAQEAETLNLLDDSVELSEEQQQNIENSVNFWKAITCDPEFIESHMVQTKADPGGFIPEVTGHWELVRSTTTIESDTTQLITTLWHQDSPYNNYCPYMVSMPNYRAYVGCVAIAGGQMLNYLHHKWNYSPAIPTSAVCNCDVSNYNSENMYQFNASSSAWAAIDSGDDDKIAVLLARIGNMVNMNYTDSGSFAYHDLLPSQMFNQYGIGCSNTRQIDSLDLVRSIRVNEMPVLANAYASREWQGISLHYYDGHTFVIDKCSRQRMKYIYEYGWIYDDPEAIQSPVDPRIEVEYGSTIHYFIGMNWGYPDGINNDIWYTPSGRWTISLGMGDYSFRYKREFIYNFDLI